MPALGTSAGSLATRGQSAFSLLAPRSSGPFYTPSPHLSSIRHFSKEPWFLSLMNDIRNQAPGTMEDFNATGRSDFIAYEINPLFSFISIFKKNPCSLRTENQHAPTTSPVPSPTETLPASSIPCGPGQKTKSNQPAGTDPSSGHLHPARSWRCRAHNTGSLLLKWAGGTPWCPGSLPPFLNLL